MQLCVCFRLWETEEEKFGHLRHSQSIITTDGWKEANERKEKKQEEERRQERQDKAKKKLNNAKS